MEFRWLTSEERRAKTVESGSLAEVLALAQQLQAEAEGLLSEEQVVEMGRELGIRPEYVREALALRQRVAQPAQALEPELVSTADRPLAAVAHALLMVFAVGMLFGALHALAESGIEPVPFCAILASLFVGWVARYPRLAAVGGALTVPIVLFIGVLYSHGSSQEAIILSLLSLGPLCSLVGRGAARLRRWSERLAERPKWMARGS